MKIDKLKTTIFYPLQYAGEVDNDIYTRRIMALDPLYNLQHIGKHNSRQYQVGLAIVLMGAATINQLSYMGLCNPTQINYYYTYINRFNKKFNALNKIKLGDQNQIHIIYSTKDMTVYDSFIQQLNKAYSDTNNVNINVRPIGSYVDLNSRGYYIHNVAANDVRFFFLGNFDFPYEKCRWEYEKQLYDPLHLNNVLFRSDAIYSYKLEDNTSITTFLETDSGLQRLEALTDKIEKYKQYLLHSIRIEKTTLHFSLITYMQLKSKKGNNDPYKLDTIQKSNTKMIGSNIMALMSHYELNSYNELIQLIESHSQEILNDYYADYPPQMAHYCLKYIYNYLKEISTLSNDVMNTDDVNQIITVANQYKSHALSSVIGLMIGAGAMQKLNSKCNSRRKNIFKIILESPEYYDLLRKGLDVICTDAHNMYGTYSPCMPSVSGIGRTLIDILRNGRFLDENSPSEFQNCLKFFETSSHPLVFRNIYNCSVQGKATKIIIENISNNLGGYVRANELFKNYRLISENNIAPIFIASDYRDLYTFMAGVDTSPIASAKFYNKQEDKVIRYNYRHSGVHIPLFMLTEDLLMMKYDNADGKNKMTYGLFTFRDPTVFESYTPEVIARMTEDNFKQLIIKIVY